MSKMISARYSKSILIQRLVWNIIWNLTIRPFPRILVRRWEFFVLRLLGAKIGKGCNIYPSTKILIPSYLTMEDGAAIANDVYLQNSAPIHLKKRSLISQGSYLCAGTHDYTKKSFPNVRKPIVIGEDAWVTANCFIGLGVTVGDGAVIGATSSVFKDVEPWTVVGGNPAKFIKKRVMKEDNPSNSSEMGGGK